MDFVLWGVAGSDQGFSFKSTSVFGPVFSTRETPDAGIQEFCAAFLGLPARRVCSLQWFEKSLLGSSFLVSKPKRPVLEQPLCQCSSDLCQVPSDAAGSR